MAKLLFFFLCIVSIASAQGVNLTITVTGIKNNTGKITAEVYNSKGNFLEKAYKINTSKINSNTANVVFNDLPKGTYTVMVYHDQNNNGKLDKNFIGMPKEPVACSNNAKGFMGPPKYDDTKFTLETDKSISIKMNEKL